MDEEQLLTLQTQLEELGKSIDSKLEDYSKKAKTLSGEELKKLKEEMKADMEKPLKEYNEKNAKLQDQVDALETKLQRVNIDINPANKSFKEALKEQLTQYAGTEKLSQKVHAAKGFELELKVDNMTEANTDTGAVIMPQRVPGIVFNPDRREHVRDFLAAGTTNSSSITFVYEGAITDSTAVSAEGAVYNQSDFDLAVSTATVRKITAFIMLSEEMLDDIEGLTSYISVRLPAKLKCKEDYELLYGPGTGNHLTGLTVGATAYSDSLADSLITRIDVLSDAIRQIRSQEYQATAIFLNPVDAWKIYLTKDSLGQYIQPWIFMPSGQITLNGVPVIVTTAITSGQFLVGDFQLGCQIYDRKQASLEFSYEDQDDFVRGMVTVRIAERLTLAIYRALCFIYGSFTAALAQGSA
jgi:HK97 family phage major capsid protein